MTVLDGDFTRAGRNKALAARVERYDALYFGDMAFRPGSIPEWFTTFEDQAGNGRWGHCSMYDPYVDRPPMLNRYTFKVTHLGSDDAGICSKKDRTVKIDERDAEDPLVIMHEMIHVYEQCYTQREADIAIYALARHLRQKIKRLDDMVYFFLHFRTRDEFPNLITGDHGLLFFLKSLDLDLRLDVPLGSFCGYGFEDIGKLNFSRNVYWQKDERVKTPWTRRSRYICP
jgi:hypothetical protein